MFQMAGDEQGGSLPVRHDQPGKGCQEQGQPREELQGQRGEDTCTDQPQEPGGGVGEENWGQSWEPLAPLKDFPSPHRSS